MKPRITLMAISALQATVLLYVTYNLTTNTLSSKKNFTQLKENSKKQFHTHNLYNIVKEFSQKTITNTKTTVLKNKQDSNEKPFIRVDYKYNHPSEDSISKLSTKQLLALEQVTDPLVESPICEDKVFLLVLVTSIPENSDRRRLIRESWGYSYEKDVKLLKKTKKFQEGKFSSQTTFKMVFVMSQSTKGDVIMNAAREEGQTYNDIVFGSSVENYRNLTLKTKLALKWSYYDCSSVYTIKTDDDVFVNPVPLVEWLKDQTTKNLYTGRCFFNSPVVRDKHNKWYVSFEDYKEKIYPRYCLGFGYLLSSDVVGALLKLSYGRSLFPMEDIYVGLIVKEIVGVKVRDERNHFDFISTKRRVGCKMNELYLAHHISGDNVTKHIENSRKALQTCNL